MSAMARGTRSAVAPLTAAAFQSTAWRGAVVVVRRQLSSATKLQIRASAALL